MIPKILVTGGAGFIGSNVNKMLNQAGYQTIVLDNLSQGDARAVAYGTLIEGDVGDAKLLDRIMTENKIQAVIHFAASINVGESVVDPEKYYNNNFANTLVLIDSMRRNGVSNFVYSSSAAVYGIPKTAIITEDHPKLPINPYGRTKLMMEELLDDYDKAYGFRSTALRYFNAAGGDPDGEIKNYQKKDLNLIPIVLRSLIKKNFITVFGTDYPTPDGTCVRDYIHVHDLGRAHLMAMERLIKGGSTQHYNLGNGHGYSVKEVIAATEKTVNQKVDARFGERRAGDPPFLVADATKANRDLGWKPAYPSLESMIGDAWKAMN